MAEATPAEEVVGLIVVHQRDLFRYIYSILPHEEDARDVLQETCIALYGKAAEYDPQRRFLSWACGFAYCEVLKRRARDRRNPILLSAEVIELLAREREAKEADLGARLRALENCLSKLPQDDRRLIRNRYYDAMKSDELIQQLKITRRTLFRNLGRVRRVLFDCVSRRVADEAGA